MQRGQGAAERGVEKRQESKHASYWHQWCARQVVKRTYEWLAEQPEDADELVALLSEAAPRLGVAAAVSGVRAHPRTPRRLPPEPGACLRQRLAAAVPMRTGTSRLGTTAFLPIDVRQVLHVCYLGHLYLK